MPCVLLSQQEYQEQQNSLHLDSKTTLEITVPTSTMVFIIFNLDKGVTNNLMIVMRNFVMIGAVKLLEVL